MPIRVEEQSYREFSARIQRTSSEAHLPLVGTFELTRRCPLHCVHCFNSLPVQDVAAHQRELATTEVIRILDEIVDAGCLWLLFTGGEIFVRPDFFAIYRHAMGQGLLLTLFTNALLITDDIADQLAEHPPFSIEVTLYGARQETYEAVTQVSGSFQRCLAGIARLRQRGLALQLKTMATRLTEADLLAMKDIAKTLAVPFRFDAMINAPLDERHDPCESRLSAETIVTLDLGDDARREQWQRLSETFLGAKPAANVLYHCGAGKNAFAIDPYGGLSLCLLSTTPQYDLRSGNFRTGWDQFLRAARAEPPRRETKCTQCGLKSLCGMCPATAQLESGDPEEPIDFFCRVAHLRAYAMGRAVPPHGPCAYCPGGSAYAELEEAAQRVTHGGGACAAASACSVVCPK